MSEYSLKGLNISAVEFLGAFFSPNEKVCFRLLSDKANTAFSGLKLEKEQDAFCEIEPALKEHNKANRGVFFCRQLRRS